MSNLRGCVRLRWNVCLRLCAGCEDVSIWYDMSVCEDISVCVDVSVFDNVSICDD